MTIPEACERVRVSRATLYKLIKRGALPLVKIGGKSLIAEDALQKLIGAASTSKGAEDQGWMEYYEQLLRLGLATHESRQAILAPTFTDFIPIEVIGKPASELIIEERAER
ncbi:MAG: helix-turn-helix domain-containing protein [Candidatus Binatia bacterium]